MLTVKNTFKQTLAKVERDKMEEQKRNDNLARQEKWQ